MPTGRKSSPPTTTGFIVGAKRGPVRLEAVLLDAVVAPRGDQQRAAVIRGQVVRLVRDDAARCLAGAGDHAQRAGQLAVPGGERVQALAAVAKPIAVIAAVDDVQEPARRARIGVVVHREQPAERVERHVERVPEPGGDPLELRAVGPASVDVASFAAAGKRRPVAADQPIIGTEVLAQAEVDVVREIEREARQAVVRIVARRVEPDDRRGELASRRSPSAWPSPSRSSRR